MRGIPLKLKGLSCLSKSFCLVQSWNKRQIRFLIVKVTLIELVCHVSLAYVAIPEPPHCFRSNIALDRMDVSGVNGQIGSRWQRSLSG